MLHHIERLRQKPEHHRRALAFTVSFVVTGLIALTWAAGLGGKLSAVGSQTASVREAINAGKESFEVKDIDTTVLFEKLREQAEERAGAR